MTSTELKANRRLTDAFIRTRPECIILTPYERIEDDQGSCRWQKGEPRAQQIMRLVEPSQASSLAVFSVRSEEGQDRRTQFELIGSYCAEMGVFDRFTIDGLEYEITDIWPDNGYEKRATVIRRGQE